MRYPVGPVTWTLRIWPPVASTNARAKPSPPSASGTFRTAAVGIARRMPSSIQSAAVCELMLPLKPEGQTRTLMLIDMEGGTIKDEEQERSGVKEVECQSMMPATGKIPMHRRCCILLIWHSSLRSTRSLLLRLSLHPFSHYPIVLSVTNFT